MLGADASSHCGYPLGRQLVSELVRLRGSKDLDDLPNGWDRSTVEDFLTELSRWDPSSIDAFLEANRGYLALGKFLIARQLKRLESVDRLFPPDDAGWYRYLFDCVFANGTAEFALSRLKIVTFNYDRSLEAYLHTRIQSVFKLTSSQAFEVLGRLPVVHVHGCLGDVVAYPYESTASIDKLIEISQRIQVIHEIDDRHDGFCNAMFRAAHDWFVDAERIYFLGFGFHADNLRRFRFFSQETTKNKLLRATLPGAGPQEQKALLDRLGPLGFPTEAITSFTCNQFFSFVAGLE